MSTGKTAEAIVAKILDERGFGLTHSLDQDIAEGGQTNLSEIF